MTDLNFADELVINKFSHSNSFTYWSPDSLNDTTITGDSLPLYFCETDENKPFIMTSGKHTHKGRLTYSKYRHQFNGRVIIAKRAKEIFNTAKMPLTLLIRGHNYLIGKGFLARVQDNNINILFVACYSGSKPTSVEQIKLLVSKQIYAPAYAYLLPMITEDIKSHIGDVIIARDINKYLGHKITLPKLGTVGEKLKFNKELLLHCISKEKVNLDIAV